MELEILEARPNLSPCTDNSYGIGQSVAITPRTINIFWIAYGVYPKLNKETICIGMCRSLRAGLVPKPILHGLAFSGKLCLASGGEPIPLTFFGSEKTRLRGPQGDPVRNPNTYSSFSIFWLGKTRRESPVEPTTPYITKVKRSTLIKPDMPWGLVCFIPKPCGFRGIGRDWRWFWLVGDLMPFNPSHSPWFGEKTNKGLGNIKS